MYITRAFNQTTVNVYYKLTNGYLNCKYVFNDDTCQASYFICVII